GSGDLPAVTTSIPAAAAWRRTCAPRYPVAPITNRRISSRSLEQAAADLVELRVRAVIIVWPSDVQPVPVEGVLLRWISARKQIEDEIVESKRCARLVVGERLATQSVDAHADSVIDRGLFGELRDLAIVSRQHAEVDAHVTLVRGDRERRA